MGQKARKGCNIEKELLDKIFYHHDHYHRDLQKNFWTKIGEVKFFFFFFFLDAIWKTIFPFEGRNTIQMKIWRKN